ncbi:hypothetical protein [Pantoea sp. Z09]|uniref:hypothetical protein n=1 Tax=Pantoea sp. Z09 TaxID=2886821 RepID=UPI001EFDA495|nr:hypothetical protein [Pantoea sp. Z09]
MRNAQGFKKRYLLILLLPVLVWAAFKIAHFNPLEQRLLQTIPVTSQVNLYITEASAGATTDFSYRFYLYDARKDAHAFMASLKDDQQPFMITSHRNALQKVDDGAIYLSVKGTVYRFTNTPSCRVGNSIYSVPVYLTATPY